MILLETQKLEAGTSSSILRLNNDFARKYLADTCLTSLLAFIHELVVHLDYEHWVPRNKEEIVMDTLHRFRFDPNRIKVFKKARLSFKILYRSDVYSLRGTSVLLF